MKPLFILALACAVFHLSFAISSPRIFHPPAREDGSQEQPKAAPAQQASQDRPKKIASPKSTNAMLKMRCRNPVYRRTHREECQQFASKKLRQRPSGETANAPPQRPPQRPQSENENQNQNQPPSRPKQKSREGGSADRPKQPRPKPRPPSFQRPKRDEKRKDADHSPKRQDSNDRGNQQEQQQQRDQEDETRPRKAPKPKKDRSTPKRKMDKDPLPKAFLMSTRKPLTKHQENRVRIFINECKTRPFFVKKHWGICLRVLGKDWMENFKSAHPDMVIGETKKKSAEKQETQEGDENPPEKKPRKQPPPTGSEEQRQKRARPTPPSDRQDETEHQRQPPPQQPSQPKHDDHEEGEDSDATLMKKCSDAGWVSESPHHRQQCINLMTRRRKRKRRRSTKPPPPPNQNQPQPPDQPSQPNQQQQPSVPQQPGGEQQPQPPSPPEGQQMQPGPAGQNPPPQPGQPGQPGQPNQPPPSQPGQPGQPPPVPPANQHLKPYLPNVAEFTPEQRAIFARNCKSEHFATASKTNEHICRQMKSIENHRQEEREQQQRQNAGQPPNPPQFGQPQPNAPQIPPPNVQPPPPNQPGQPYNPPPGGFGQQPPPPPQNMHPADQEPPTAPNANAGQPEPERLPVALLTHPCLPMDSMCRPALTFDIRDPVSVNMPIEIEWKMNGQLMGRKKFRTQRITFDMFSKVTYEFRLVKREGGSDRVLAAFETDRIKMQRPSNLPEPLFVQLKLKPPVSNDLETWKSLMATALGPDAGRIGVAQRGEWILYRGPANDRNRMLLEKLRGAVVKQYATIPIFCLEGGKSGNSGAVDEGDDEEESSWFQSTSFLIYAGLFALGMIGVGTYYVFSSGAMNPVIKQSSVLQAVNQRRGRPTKTEMEPLVSNEETYRTSPRGLPSTMGQFEQKRRSVPGSQFSG